MADKQTFSNTLTMVAEFTDGDDRTLTQDNPDSSKNLTGLVKELGTLVKDNQILIGDKAGAAFTRFKSAQIKRKTTTVLDLD